MLSVMNTSNSDSGCKSDVVKDEGKEEPRGLHGKDVVRSSDLIDVDPSGDSELTPDVRGKKMDSVFDFDEDMDSGDKKVNVNAGVAGQSDSDKKGTSLSAGENEQMESKVKGIGNGVVSRSSNVKSLGSKSGKGVVKSGESSVSDYDSMLSMFDEFAAGGSGGTGALGSSRTLGNYENGDMVWGKVKSHPWWPGQIYNEEFASPSVRRTKREGNVLVAFFGDSSYGWFDPAELIPFDANFAEKSRQTTARPFLKAVEEAVDEASRRRGLGLSCKCRNAYNFRPTDVKGYFAVDVDDYGTGSIYSIGQIKKARDGFQPVPALDFVRQLALSPTSCDHDSIHFIQNKAALFAYRKAVYEEFDDTYAQAFGQQPERPSPVSVHELPPAKIASGAALSGRLVFAETLGKEKSSGKPDKSKDQAKKDKYLFKRRDDVKEVNIHQTKDGQLNSSSLQPVNIESGSQDFVLQKRAPTASSTKPKLHKKREIMGIPAKDRVPASDDGIRPSMSSKKLKVPKKRERDGSQVSGGMPGSENVFERDSSGIGVSSFPDAPPGYSSHLSLVPDKKVDSGSVMTAGSGRMSESGASDDKLSEATAHPHDHSTSSSAIKVAGGLEQTPRPVQRKDQLLGDGNYSGPKKVKVHKRSAGEMSAEKIVMGEKKRRKKELLGSDGTQVHVKDGAVAGKVVAATENLQALQSKIDGGIITNTSDELLTREMANVELSVPQALSDLHALALDPFLSVERRRPAIIKQVFLRFRSLVYQKSLPLSPPAEEESANKAHAEDVMEMSPEKPRPRPSIRPDDPTKGGRKRGLSDRQEELSAKKKKKVNDALNSAAEKKIIQKTPESVKGDASRQAVPSVPKKAGPVSMKKSGHPPPRAIEPTMLNMKFPVGGSLPSANELKARFARFGPLDHQGMRIFGKTLTCRVVFLYKADAEAAYKSVVASKELFRNVGVKCQLRDLAAAGSESEPVKPVFNGVQPAAFEQKLPATTPAAAPTVLKSCLKKPGGEDTAGGGNGGGNGGKERGTRVKFMLSGEENYRNNSNNNASFADGGTLSSSSSMDLYSKNFQKGNLLLPSQSSSIPVTSVNAQYAARPAVVSHHSTELAPPVHSHTPHTRPELRPPYTHPELQPPPRTAHHNFNMPVVAAPKAPNVDIQPQMLHLLTRCNDVVNNVKNFLGYMPYHPL